MKTFRIIPLITLMVGLILLLSIKGCEKYREKHAKEDNAPGISSPTPLPLEFDSTYTLYPGKDTVMVRILEGYHAYVDDNATYWYQAQNSEPILIHPGMEDLELGKDFSFFRIWCDPNQKKTEVFVTFTKRY